MHQMNKEELKKNLFNILDDVIEYNDSATINTCKGNAVILSEEDYNGMLETIHVLSQKGLHKKIKDGEREEANGMKKYNPNEKW